jgi:hypothetical protein
MHIGVGINPTRHHLITGRMSLRVQSLTNPNRVVVTSAAGHTATFTVGARTVPISGMPVRTFTEQKRVGPITRDSFTRTTTSRWSVSPCYGLWSVPVGGLDTDYTCDGSVGRIVLTTTNSARYISLRDDDLTNYDVRCRFATTTMPAGASNSFALTGSYVDSNNHYRFRATLNTTGTVQVAMDSVVAGVSTTIGANVTAGTGYAANQWWWLRASNVNGTLNVKAWLDGGTEPAAWQLTVANNALGAGRVGIRAFTSTGATNAPTFLVDEFEITSGIWAHPPVTTHDTWVRLLGSPFNAWNYGAESWFLSAIQDTSKDVLARGMDYITGAPSQSKYGPDNPDGTRVEGADFNDFLGIHIDYPNLASPTFDNPEPAQLGCMDCTGFVRMIYGYWGGVPMSLTQTVDANGINLPRRAVLLGPNGPGTLIAGDGTNPPPTTGIQIGDVLTWNADKTDDDVEQTDDHSGYYMGVDTAGNQRFISSRKTANGPTISDLGGASILNGTGTYAGRIRHIRRI